MSDLCDCDMGAYDHGDGEDDEHDLGAQYQQAHLVELRSHSRSTNTSVSDTTTECALCSSTVTLHTVDMSQVFDVRAATLASNRPTQLALNALRTTA